MKNLKTCFFDLYQKGGHFVKDFGTIAVVSSLSKSCAFNLIINPEREINTNIRENIKQSLIYANQFDVPFVFIQYQDSDLSSHALLSEFGFSYSYDSTWVSISHNRFHFEDNQRNQSFHIQRVNNDELFSEWCRTIGEAFSIADDAKKTYDTVTSYIYNDTAEHHLYLLRDNQDRCISGMMLYLPKEKNLDAGHYCWGTIASERHKGAMSYLVELAIDKAKKSGYQNSIAQCNVNSIHLAEKIGFAPQAKLNMFTNIVSKKG